MSRVPFQYPIRRLIVRSRKVSKLWDLYAELPDWIEFWKAPQQHCCCGSCSISKWCHDSNYQPCSFATSRDITIRCFIRYWNRALLAPMPDIYPAIMLENTEMRKATQAIWTHKPWLHLFYRPLFFILNIAQFWAADKENTVWCLYNMVNFLQNPHKKTLHSSPVRGSYEVSFVSTNFLFSTSVTAAWYVISWYIGARYNDTRLYFQLLFKYSHRESRHC